MKDKELMLEETETSHTLGGSIKYTEIHSGVAIGLVALRGPIHLRICVSEERGDGEGPGS